MTGAGTWWTPTNPAGARWFARSAAGQVERSGADGLFLDSVSPPNQLGTWDPPLPAHDPTFEAGWSRRIASWLGWLRETLDVPIIANAGAWVTSRDTTDYSSAAGVMIEGFALPWADVSPEDWALQMDRALSVVRDGDALIAQAYPDTDDVAARMFILGSYLLVKGDRTYVNLEVAEEPTWFPEYDLPLGPALDAVPATVEALRDGDVFVRRYAEATVVVNPSPGDVTWATACGAALRTTDAGGRGHRPGRRGAADLVAPSTGTSRRRPRAGAAGGRRAGAGGGWPLRVPP